MNEPNGAQPVAVKPREYFLSEGERRHIDSVQAQLEAQNKEILEVEGVLRRKERELTALQRHLGMYLGAVAVEAGLPLGATLSPDRTKLIARD